jgi:hypothetical protein
LTKRGPRTRRATGVGLFAFATAAALTAALLFPLEMGKAPPARAKGSASRSRAYGEGRLVTVKLPSSPFPHASRSEGYSYEGEDYPLDPHYDDSSATVYVPSGFEPGRSVDLAIFFHGWFSSREEAEEEFSLVEQFEGSGARALLVIPETAKDAPNSFGGKLEDSGGFERFVRDLLSALWGDCVPVGAAPGRIVLAGHSGAYRVISKILGSRGGLYGRLREVYLFDGLFGGEDVFLDWIKERGGRFVCLYSEGGGTEENARDLASSLKKIGISSTWADDDPAEDTRSLASRVVFLGSGSDHYGIVHERDEFRRLLTSSRVLRKR